MSVTREKVDACPELLSRLDLMAGPRTAEKGVSLFIVSGDCAHYRLGVCDTRASYKSVSAGF